AAGTVDLCEVANTVTRTLAASDTATGASVMCRDSSCSTVRAVAADVCAAGATGITTNNGDVDLVSTAGPIRLTNAINTGAASTEIGRASCRERDDTGAVDQAAAGAGAITARALAVVANWAVN